MMDLYEELFGEPERFDVKEGQFVTIEGKTVFLGAPGSGGGTSSQGGGSQDIPKQISELRTLAADLLRQHHALEPSRMRHTNTQVRKLEDQRRDLWAKYNAVMDKVDELESKAGA